MKRIICDFNLFDMNQVISVMNDDGTISTSISSTMDSLAHDIVDLCHSEHINKVHLCGSEKYAYQAILPSILEYNKSTYGIDNIEIEVVS